MRHDYHAEQWLPYPVGLVFEFFANPQNLPHLMPAWQKTRIEASDIIPPPAHLAAELDHPPTGIIAGTGTRMSISFRPFPFSPIRVTWDAEITDFTWNESFCDVQHRGPFSYWRHCHSLEPQLRGALDGTLLRDHVEYELPFGSLGDLADRLFVKKQMESIFHYRQDRTTELLAQFSLEHQQAEASGSSSAS